jgi:hypothetical protein
MPHFAGTWHGCPSPQDCLEDWEAMDQLRKLTGKVSDFAPFLLLTLALLFWACGGWIVVSEQTGAVGSGVDSSSGTTASATASVTASSSTTTHSFGWLGWTVTILGFCAFAFALHIRNKRRI